MNDVDDYFYPLYNVIISKIEPSQQYDYYYIVNIDMLFFKTKEKEVSYIDGLRQLIDTTITDNKLSKIKNGEALLIFDFGSEKKFATPSFSSLIRAKNPQSSA